MLFRREARERLKGEVELIIDTIRSVRCQFNNQVSAAYLKLLNREITEKIITSKDIKTFILICEQVL